LEECSSSSSEKEKECDESINYVKNPLINLSSLVALFFFSELKTKKKEAVSSEFLFPPDFFFSH
jgi:hypothetical protein